MLGLTVGIYLYNDVYHVDAAAFQLVAGLFLMVPLLILRPLSMSRAEKRLSKITLLVAVVALLLTISAYLLSFPGQWENPDFKDSKDLLLGVGYGVFLAVFAEGLTWATDETPEKSSAIDKSENPTSGSANRR